MGNEGYLQKAYIYIGGLFSVFYLVVGLFLCTGKLTFGMEPSMRFFVGVGIMAYGIFRAFMFYKRYKDSKKDSDYSEDK